MHRCHTPSLPTQPSYHSSFNETEGLRSVAGVAVCPIRAENSKGVAPVLADGEGEDIVDEVLKFFRANMLFTQFDIEGDADRTLIYLTAVASDIIKKTCKVAAFDEAQKMVTTYTATKTFKIPGDAGFLPGLGHFFEKPSTKSNADFLRQYLQVLE